MNAQELILSRILPIAVAIMLLWIVYRLLFTNSNRLKFNRSYILISIIFALSLPLLGVLIGYGSPQISSLKHDLFGGIFLNDIVVTPNEVAEAPVDENALPPVEPAFTPWEIGLIIYLIGVGISLILLIFKLGKIFFMIIRSHKEKCNGYTAVYTGKDHGSFSFLNYAFFPDKSVSHEIVSHEISHISHCHSWDILFMEIMMVVQWFNPFIYLFKRDLQCIHEYQADRDVVDSGADKRDYMMLILQQCTAVDFSRMSNNFSLILTKKRIKMITKNEKTKGLWWRLLVTLPVLAVMLVANTNATAKEQNEEQPKAEVKNLEDIRIKISQSKDSIYNTDALEVMPEFPGGNEAMVKFIQENVVYPEKAKEKGISGKTFVSFTIEKDGSISDVKVLRGCDKECDAEAVRVVKSMPKWTPGKVKGQFVRVNFTMPFVFKAPQK